MATKRIAWTKEKRAELLKTLRAEAGDLRAAASKMQVSENALRSIVNNLRIDYKAMRAKKASSERLVTLSAANVELTDKVRELRAQLAEAQREALDVDTVRERIIGLASAPPAPPKWTLELTDSHKSPGVPTLFASDWHWGEVVDPTQIGGVNKFNVEIAHKRARAFVQNAVDLLTRHMVNPTYPGIVMPVGGDMFSGDIHEELMATNETELGPAFVDLFGVMIWVVTTLAESFGNVYVPWVTGNHGRWTMKLRAKGRAFTSFDWLLGQMLEKHFEKDGRVRFTVASGPDVLYRVYNHKYLLTHGDQFRGGDGMVGALGPIIRGDTKKRSRNMAVKSEYDTLLIGHWHQWMPMRRVIVNGSLKGYDEYANQGNFPFEPPTQGCWITHPRRGVTFTAPIFLEESSEGGKTPWVSWV